MQDNLSFEQLPKAVSQLYEKLSAIESLLLNQTNQLLTIQQEGELIRLTVPTLYGYVRRNEIPFSKKGKRLYFSKQELTDWIMQGRRKTIAEINAEAHTYLKKKGG